MKRVQMVSFNRRDECSQSVTAGHVFTNPVGFWKLRNEVKDEGGLPAP